MRFLKSLLGPFCIVFSFSSLLNAQDCKEAVHLLKVLETYHYLPLEFDDTLSGQVYDAFIDNLDQDRLFLLEEDENALRPYRFRLDEDMASGDCSFFEEAARRYQVRLREADTLLDHMGGRAFLPEGKRVDTTFAQNKEVLADRWENWLAKAAYRRFLDLADSLEERSWEKEKPFLLEQVVQKEHCFIQSQLSVPGGFKAQLLSDFLNTLCEGFDPHTNYFSADVMESFESSLSREAYSFGLELKKSEKGEIEIARLLPGGPAWKSNQLNKGDLLLQIRFANGDPIDLFCADVYVLEELLRTADTEELQVTVRKRSGQVKTVALFKEKMEVEENVVKGFLLKGKVKSGYIYLPGFYTEWENQEGKGCADDVARELLKLQMEGIEGLILDLRFNGGGSIKEAMDLAGIFINEGPLCLHQGRDREPGLLKDANRGTMYSGPLVVLVNGLSASASEMLAACLQDYNRALIVGSPTFGKASGQQILPLGWGSNSSFVKITMQRFYRLDGSSLQLQGVIPDVVLPEILGFLIPREQNSSTALPNDSVSKPVIFHPQQPLPSAKLAALSLTRREADPYFVQMKSLNHALALYFEDPVGSDKQLRRQAMEDLESLDKLVNGHPITAYEVANHQFNLGVLQMDKARSLMNEQQIKKIQQDLLLEEAFQVLADLIDMNH